MRKGKTDLDKLSSRTEVCLFVGYPKGTISGIFYSPLDQKVFVNANAVFLENDYIMNHKSNSKLVLEEISSTSQIAMLKSMRIILSILAHLDYEYGKWMSRLLLNGYLDEEIYMKQPNGFIVKG